MLKNNLKLNALAWKANSIGESYGQFCVHLSENEKDLIFAEYEQLIEQKQQAELERLEKLKLNNSKRQKRNKQNTAYYD